MRNLKYYLGMRVDTWTEISPTIDRRLWYEEIYPHFIINQNVNTGINMPLIFEYENIIN